MSLVMLAAASARAATPASARCWFPGEPAPTREQIERIDSLSIAIGSLPDHADCRPLGESLRQLLREPCFRALETVSPLAECRSALALRDWWTAGGLVWVRSAVLGEYRSPRELELPPGMRPALTADANPGHPLAPLLCRVGDAACGRETLGWLKRAEDVMAYGDSGARAAERADPSKTCVAKAAGSGAERYPKWRDCIEQHRHRHALHSHLPASRFRSPTRGWLVIRGRRGHYTFTDELAAYDLETGAAFRARRAGDLGILPAEDAAAVERGKTGRRPVLVERGRVAIDDLREAALILLLWPERRLQLESLTVKLPDRLEHAALPPGFKFTEGGRIVISSSGDTALTWEWIREGRVILSGETAYTGQLGGRGYPSWLLEIAESSLAPGCPPVALPAGILGLGRPITGVSPLDARPAELDAAEIALAKALTGPDPACAKPK